MENKFEYYIEISDKTKAEAAEIVAKIKEKIETRAVPLQDCDYTNPSLIENLDPIYIPVIDGKPVIELDKNKVYINNTDFVLNNDGGKSVVDVLVAWKKLAETNSELKVDGDKKTIDDFCTMMSEATDEGIVEVLVDTAKENK